MKLIRVLKTIQKSFSHYQPSVEIFISRSGLLRNLTQHQKRFPKLSFAPVLKSNAYGHGLSEVARILDKEDIPFFATDSLHEAIILRKEGTKSKILVIGYTNVENINAYRLSNVDITIVGFGQLQKIAGTLRKPRTFHLKIDTGMHRQGMSLDQISEALSIIKNHRYINLEGICSHLANADGVDDTFTKLQIDRWNEVVRIFKKNFPDLKYYHLAASAGTYFTNQTLSNVARLGIGLYGVNSSPLQNIDLKPVLQMESVISDIKVVPKGEFVGYNLTYQTDKTTKVATIPAGYFEGIDLRLSNVGHLGVAGLNCPIIGRVSMNITTIDVTGIPNPKIGERTVIISNRKEDPNSVESIARLVGTIPYEILAHLPQHLRRTIVD